MSPVLRRALSGLKPLSVNTVQPSLRAALTAARMFADCPES